MDQKISTVMPDVQSSIDQRNIAIHRVGIKSLKYPIVFAGEPSVAEFAMTVALPADQKGTHMSRFTALLEARRHALDMAAFAAMHTQMLEKLDAAEGTLQASFALFVQKAAPVTGVSALMDYQVTIIVSGTASDSELTLSVLVPVTSLCPCSKMVSDYGAHNQRSHITMSVTTQATQVGVSPIDLILIAEQQASSELYGLLKRADEKYVTERAYDNPKFVEDLVRDVAAALQNKQQTAKFLHWQVEAENFEAIHNHSAYALVKSA